MLWSCLNFYYAEKNNVYGDMIAEKYSNVSGTLTLQL